MNKDLEILETLAVIMDRLDDIEEKLIKLNDPYNLKNLKILPSTLPEGYTLIDSTTY